MFKPYRRAGITPLGMLLAGTTLLAQVNTGQLNGFVLDTQGHPLAGAKVLLRSPQLMQQREVRTGPTGEWRAPLLPPGNYQILFSREGYLGRSVTNLRVGVGATQRQDITLSPLAVQEAVVEVVGSTSSLDKTETKTATNFSSDLLVQLTGAADFTSATDFTSGVASSPQGTPIIRGGQTAGNIYSVNGNDVKDPMWGQPGATWYLQDSVEDVQVVLSPLNARNGRTLGGTVNVVTKSGGNDFEGSLRWTPSRSNNWQAADHAWVNRGWNERSDAFARRTDIMISGPIIKDRLWFSFGTYLIPDSAYQQWLESEPDATYRRPIKTGIDAIDTLTALNSDLTSVSKPGYAFPSFNYGQPYAATQKNTYYEGKITLGLSADHRISVFGSQEKSKCNPTWAVPLSVDQINPTTYKNTQYGFTYNGILGAGTFVDARFTHSSQNYMDNYGSTARDPNHTGISLFLDSLDPAQTGNTYYQFANQELSGMGGGAAENRANTNIGINLKLFRDALGVQHDIDMGVDYYRADLDTTAQRGGLNEFVTVGGVLAAPDGSWVFPTIVYPGGGKFGQSVNLTWGLAPTLYKYYGKDGTAKNPDLGLYVNDQVTLSKNWNLMFGLRYDKVRSIDTTGATLISTQNLSPRFVATYDPLGNSVHVIKFSASRLASDYPLQLTSQFFSNAASTGVHLMWKGVDGQLAIPASGVIPDGTASSYLKWVTMAQLVDVNNYGTPTAFYNNTKAWQIDPNLKPMHCSEYTLEYRHAFPDGSFTRMAYVYRKFSDLWATSRDYSEDYWYTQTDTSGANPPLRSKLIQQSRVFNSDELWRDYHGIELEANMKITSVFSTRISYTYSRLRGNDNTLDGDSTQYYGDTSITGRYLYPTYNSASMDQRSPSGALRNDVPHRLRVTTQMLLPVGKGGWVSYAASFRYDVGANWEATASDTYSSTALAAKYAAVQALADGDSRGIAPNAISVPTTWTRYYSQRGAYHLNDAYQMDLVITWEVPVVRKFRFIGALTVANVFNHTLQTSYDRTMDANNSSGTQVLHLDATKFGGTRQDAFGDYAFWNSARSVTFNTGFKF